MSPTLYAGHSKLINSVIQIFYHFANIFVSLSITNRERKMKISTNNGVFINFSFKADHFGIQLFDTIALYLNCDVFWWIGTFVIM